MTTNDPSGTATPSTFKRLLETNVSRYIEQKGRYSYVSWPWAVALLRNADPSARWEVVRFDGLPYQKTPVGFFVEVAVTVDGLTLSQIHPVLDGKNNPIQEPTSFDINTSIQRCLVKAIALHGLGLAVYAGEDLMNLSEGQPEEQADEDLSAAVEQIQRIAQTYKSKESLRQYCVDIQHEHPKIWPQVKEFMVKTAAGLPA